MGKQTQCRGCGSFLQSKEPDMIGYLPEHLLQGGGEERICQRCYKLIHYGQVNTQSETPDPRRVLTHGLDWAEALLIVVDLMDFAASLPEGLSQLSKGKRTLVLVNKIDLLPPRTRVFEAKAWVEREIARQGIRAQVMMVSASTGQGLDTVRRVLSHQPYKKWLVIGATSVGKSTLIKKLLQADNLQGGGLPTVARLPGTTIERVQWKLKNGLILSDTPGFVPEGRLLDQLCPSCAQKLTPAKQLNVRVYNLGPNSGLVIPGIASIKPLGTDEEVVMLGFTASDVSWQRANIQRFPQWLAKGCQRCSFKEWQTFTIDLPANHDLVIHGLGWISSRRGGLNCEVTIPANVAYTVRTNLIGAKK